MQFLAKFCQFFGVVLDAPIIREAVPMLLATMLYVWFLRKLKNRQPGAPFWRRNQTVRLGARPLNGHSLTATGQATSYNYRGHGQVSPVAFVLTSLVYTAAVYAALSASIAKLYAKLKLDFPKPSTIGFWVSVLIAIGICWLVYQRILGSSQSPTYNPTTRGRHTHPTQRPNERTPIAPHRIR